MDKSLTFTLRIKATDDKSKRVIEDLSNLDLNRWASRNAYIIEALDAYRELGENKESIISDRVVKNISDGIRQVVKEELNLFFANLLGQAFVNVSASTVNTVKPETRVVELENVETNDEFMNNLSSLLDGWNED